MEEAIAGLSLQDNGASFVLRRRENDGAVTAITMSLAELNELSETILSWKGRLSSETLDGSGQVQHVVFYPVEGVGLSHEVLGEPLLLTLTGPSGYRRTYGLPPHLIDVLSEHMPLYAAEMRAATPPKQ